MDKDRIIADSEKYYTMIETMAQKIGANSDICKKLLSKFRKSIHQLLENQDPESICTLGEIFYHLGNIDEMNSRHYFDTSIELFTESAQAEYLPALRNLGECYFFGNAVQKDVEQGLKFLEEAADKGDIKALIELSMIYFLGEDVTKDLEKSLNYLTIAVKTEDPEAMLYMGRYFFSQKDFATALPWFQKSADAGYSDALDTLGIVYLLGKGVEPDVNRAIELFMEASEKKNPSACFHLAKIYLYGFEDVEKDELKGLRFLYQAFASGSVAAIEKYGELLIEGEIIPQNVDDGIIALTYAANHDLELAQIDLAELYLCGEKVDRDEKKAFYWLHRAAEHGAPQIIQQLALMYLQGVGTEQDIDKGVELLNKCVSLGDTSSKEYLDNLDEFLCLD